jgi:membrane protease YdiL (CAAX protease family)
VALPDADHPPASHPPPAADEPPRIVAVIVAVLTGLFIAIVGSMAVGVIFLLNLEIWPAVPWAVVPAIGFLVWLERSLSGRRLPEPVASDRRARLRAVPLSWAAWGWALAAIAPAMVGLQALQSDHAAGLPAAMPGAEPIASLLPRLPLGELAQQDLTIWALFVVNYLVAAPFLEEAAFRGYMQVPMERLLGPVAALPLVATIFALLHLDRGFFALHWTLALFLGALAWRAGSILPSILAHAAVNFSVLLGEPTLRPWLLDALGTRLPQALPPRLLAAFCALASIAALYRLGKVACGTGDDTGMRQSTVSARSGADAR